MIFTKNGHLCLFFIPNYSLDTYYANEHNLSGPSFYVLYMYCIAYSHNRLFELDTLGTLASL